MGLEMFGFSYGREDTRTPKKTSIGARKGMARASDERYADVNEPATMENPRRRANGINHM